MATGHRHRHRHRPAPPATIDQRIMASATGHRPPGHQRPQRQIPPMASATRLSLATWRGAKKSPHSVNYAGLPGSAYRRW